MDGAGGLVVGVADHDGIMMFVLVDAVAVVVVIKETVDAKTMLSILSIVAEITLGSEIVIFNLSLTIGLSLLVHPFICFRVVLICSRMVRPVSTEKSVCLVVPPLG